MWSASSGQSSPVSYSQYMKSTIVAVELNLPGTSQTWAMKRAEEAFEWAESASPTKRARLPAPPPLQPHLQQQLGIRPNPFAAPPPQAQPQPLFAEIPPQNYDAMFMDTAPPSAPAITSWPPPDTTASVCPPCFAHRFCRMGVCNAAPANRTLVSTDDLDSMMLG